MNRRQADLLDKFYLMFGIAVLIGYIVEHKALRLRRERDARDQQWDDAEAMREFYAATREKLIAEEMHVDPAISQ